MNRICSERVKSGCSAPRARKSGVLKPRVHELHITRVLQVQLGEGDQLVSGVECCHAQPSSEEAARQLTGPTADLKHSVAIADARHLACVLNERVGV